MNILSSMKKIVPILLSAFTALNLQAQTATLDIDASQKGVDISPNLYGIFYEEINHAGEGGLYAELIQNRSFEEVDRGIPNRRFDNGRGERFGRPANPNIIPYWSAVNGATMTVTTEGLLNEAQHRALLLTTDETVSKTNPAGIRNAGFWGIKATKGDKYTLTFWAKADAKKRIRFTAGLYADGAWKAQKSFTKSISEEWKKYKVVFKGKADADEAEFQLLLNAPGSVYLDMVSLFPPTFKNRPNGCRIDLAEKLAALHPTFMRFPGGCFVEGMSRETAYEWKRTIGPLEERPGHMNLNWGYPCTDGMGYHEYLQLAEDLGAEPLYVVNVGIWHGGYQPYDQIDEYIQNALDAIEYANGDASTVWGRKRIENGHKEPFNLRLIEVGNENYQVNPGEQSDHYAERYAQFYKAIKEKYPDYQVGGCATRGREMFRAEQFVSYCREQKLPLDFCSITDYRRTLEPMFAVGDELRRILDTNGFSRTTIDLAEWHYEPANWTPAPGRDRVEVGRELAGVNGGAFTASMLLLGQDSVYDRMLYYHASGDGGFWGLRGGEGGELNSHWYALKAFADLARLRHRVKTSAPRERGYAAAATRAEDGRAALMVAAFCPSDSEPVRVSVKGAGHPTEVLLEDGEAHRLSACDGWTFADGTLTLPNAGRSAVWLVTFGGYRVLRLPHLEGGKIAPKTDWTRSDLVDEDGRLAFAFVVPREMIVRGSPLIERIRALTRKTFGAVPEVYGDDDNEKISQTPALIALGQTAPIRHAKLLSFRQPGDGAYDRLAAFFLQLR